jgi:carboxymethylenebutenolidase
MSMRSSIRSLALAIVLGACGSGTGTPAPTGILPTSTPDIVGPVPTETPTAADTEAPAPALNGERITFEHDDLTLGGMLWKPAGNGPFRAVLWNHGSEKGPGVDGSNPLLGPVFAAQGYVFFMPFRRGQGTSEGTWIVDAVNAAEPPAQGRVLAELHTTSQLSDQLAGLAYLRELAYVDDASVAVAGWSYGGIQTVLGAGDLSAGYVAAVSFTPASQSWAGNPDLQEALLRAAAAADLPFLFIQAENDYSLVPTKALTDTIVADDGEATRSIYPAFGSTNQDGHEFAVRGAEIWGAEVFTFLDTAFGD